MLFQVCNTPDGYVVEAHLIDGQLSLNCGWYPLRNFGDHQGDAIEFKEYDCPRLDDSHLKMLINNYNPAVKYSRISGTKFIKQP